MSGGEKRKFALKCNAIIETFLDKRKKDLLSVHNTTYGICRGYKSFNLSYDKG